MVYEHILFYTLENYFYFIKINRTARYRNVDIKSASKTYL